MEGPSQSKASQPKESRASKALKRKVSLVQRPDPRLQVASMKVMCEPEEITHHQLEAHIIMHLEQIHLTLSALPHRRIEALTELRKNIQERRINTDIYTKGLACNILNAIIQACQLQPENLDSQLWKVSFFLMNWQILLKTRPEHKIMAWQSLEREILTAQDIMMCQCLFNQISSTHHRICTMLEACHKQENYNIILTIDE